MILYGEVLFRMFSSVLTWKCMKPRNLRSTDKYGQNYGGSVKKVSCTFPYLFFLQCDPMGQVRYLKERLGAVPSSGGMTDDFSPALNGVMSTEDRSFCSLWRWQPVNLVNLCYHGKPLVDRQIRLPYTCVLCSMAYPDNWQALDVVNADDLN